MEEREVAGENALKEEERHRHLPEAGNADTELEDQVEESREMFFNWATNKQMFATDTAVKLPIENTATYQAPGKFNSHGQWLPGAVAQLDYIMVNKNYKKAVTSSKSNCNTQLAQ